MYKFSLTFCSVLILLAPYGWAAENIKPGLWEMSMKTDSMPHIPKLSPAQQEQMRKMGIQMPEMRDGAMVSKVCITKEMAQREPTPGVDKNSGCQSKNYQRSGPKYSVDILCDGPSLKGEGKIKGTFSGSSAFSSTYEFTGTAQGQPVRQKHVSSGKWLGADCGDVKPMPDSSMR